MPAGLTGEIGDDILGILFTSDYRALTSVMKKIGDGSVDSPFNASALWLGVDKIGINENVAITATSTEINYLVGVTSNVQTQLNARALSSDLANYLTTSSAAATYQTILVSGTSIKTINSTSLLGSGDIAIVGYTDSLARAAISSTFTGLSYNSSTGVFSAAAGYFLPTTSTLSGTNTGDNATNSQYSGLAASKQDVLVSGTNLKTINSTTLLGSGDIAITPTTLGLVIGTNVQAYNANLTTYAGIAPSANVQTLLGAANYAAFKTSLSLNNVENTALSTWTGATSITTLGTIATGTWNATVIGTAKGGTGLTAIGTAGQVLRVNAGATGLEFATISGGSTNFDDSTFTIFDNGDNTKIVNFQVSGVTTGTTRTLTIPNASGTIALTSDLGSYLTTATAASTYLPLAGGTVTGAITMSGNGALSAPIYVFTGTTITGGTGTTTKPYVLIEPTGTTTTGWNTSGTYFGINVPSGFTTGYVFDFQLNGSTRANMRGRGDWVLTSDQARTLSVTSGGSAGTIYCDSTSSSTSGYAGLIISNDRRVVGNTLGTIRVGNSTSTVSRFGIANGERDRMMVITDGTNSNGLMIGTLNSNIAVFGTVDIESFRITTSQDIQMASGAAIFTVASTTTKAGLRIPHGTAPSSPTNGDIWTDTSGAYIRINGVTKTFTTT